MSRERREPTQGPDERHTGLEVAAVVLAIPSAILATMPEAILDAAQTVANKTS